MEPKDKLIMEIIKNKKNHYNVSRYFDDYFEGVIKGGLTKEEANQMADKINNEQSRAYVKYIVREE